MAELHRVCFDDQSIRADTTGRTIFGRLVPYDEVAEVSDGGMPYRERFRFGSFARSIQERGAKVRLFTMHDTRKLPVGKATDLEERHDGLHGAFSVARTRDGDEALELVSSGVVDSFSIGFRGIRDERTRDGVVDRLEASLREASLVHTPAYAGALVGGVRHINEPTISHETALRRLQLLKESIR